MNLVGTWNLEVVTPFGTHPATLVFEGAGGALNAHIDSKLGTAPLQNLSVTHNGFDATVQMEFREKLYSASISGEIDGNDIGGTIKVKFPLAPTVKYTGTRAG